MRFVTGRSGHMRASLVGWTLGAIWSLIAGGIAIAYAAARISGGTLVFLELCALALGAITLFFGGALQQPPEIVEQLLYRTEHDVRR